MSLEKKTLSSDQITDYHKSYPPDNKPDPYLFLLVFIELHNLLQINGLKQKSVLPDHRYLPSEHSSCSGFHR